MDRQRVWVIVLLALLLVVVGSMALESSAAPPTDTRSNPPVVVSGVTETLASPEAPPSSVDRAGGFAAVSGVTKTISLPRLDMAVTDSPTATMAEDFEGTWPGPGWSVTDQSSSDGGEYMWGKRDCNPHTGSFAGWSVGGGAQGNTLDCSDSYPNNANTRATYGPFDLSNAYTATLTFYLYGRSEYGPSCSYDYLFVSSSADQMTWSGVSHCGDWTGGDAGNGYHRRTLDLSSQAGESDVWISFDFHSDSTITDTGFIVDDIALDVWFRQSNTMQGNFEGDWPGPGWRVTDRSSGDGGEYLWGQRDCHPHTGSFAGWAVGGGAQGSLLACDAHHPSNVRSWAVYGPFDLSTATDANLTFYLWGQTVGEFGCSDAHLFVGSSTNGEDFAGANYCGDWTGGDAGNGYHRQTLDLSSHAGESEVWLGLGFISYSSTITHGFSIDDLTLTTSGPLPPFSLVWISSEEDNTEGAAWGDYDGDGDLDLAVGNGHSLSSDPAVRLYRNEGGELAAQAVWSSDEDGDAFIVSWGDCDGDGDLDLAVGTDSRERVYRNDGVGIDSTPSFTLTWTSDESGFTQGIAWGDYDGDADLDLAVESQHGPTRVYRNDGGMLTSSSAWESTDASSTYSVAWGDYDDDGDLDLAVGSYRPFLYRNDGGTLVTATVWSPIDGGGASVAWGDYDGDGDLDLVNGPQLYRNDAMTLTTTAVWSPADGLGGETVWIDYDGDDDLDLSIGSRLYRNDGGILTVNPVWSWEDGETGAWGDYDGDGDLDIIVGRDGHNWLYRNERSVLATTTAWSSTEEDYTDNVAWGDYDGDGDLDLAAANYWGPANRVYRNDGGTLTESAVWSSVEGDWSHDVAWGDHDGDGDLDLAIGGLGNNMEPPARLYRNEGMTLTTSAVWSSAQWDDTLSVVWGDYDGDGDLDLAAGNDPESNRLYRNDGGVLTESAIWSSAETDDTQDVAWGDYDGDGDLDLAARNYDAPNRLYRNDGGMLTASPVWSSSEADQSNILGGDAAWGDYDGDGDLDLATGNTRGPIRLYRNDGGVLTSESVWSPLADGGGGLAWGDYDGDGDLDLVMGSNGFYDFPARLYRNDGGTLTLEPIWSPVDGGGSSMAWGDYDGDGDLDLIMGSFDAPNRLYRNTRDHYAGPASIPILSIAHPGDTASADFYSSARIWTESVIPITYTLFHRQGDPVRQVQGFYSLDGGGRWLPAVATSDTITTNLASAPYPTATVTNTHVYKWDIRTSGLMGRYDNIVFRLVAIPDLTPKPNATPGPYWYGAYGSHTFPFRVRGSQVRVISDTVPIPNAIVYRLAAGQVAGARPYADLAGEPFHTDSQGYLQGRGDIHIGDQLLALVPITATDSYTLYYTSGAPTLTGLDSYTVTQTGVQTITVSSEHPLLLFNLHVSIEWDAHNDPVYIQQLEIDLEKASQYLYDFTDGQAALGQVTVHQNADYWIPAHVVIMATNRLRPLAVQGGVVLTTTVDPHHADVVYDIGQVRMGATWNRYGAPGYTSGGDWPVTLAHELSHYLLFQEDVYLGLDDSGLLIPVDTCTGSAMGDVYDPNNTEFVYDSYHWDTNCADTLANRALERPEWETIDLWYPWLTIPTAINPGPSLMPFDFTVVTTLDPITPTDTLADPTFYLDYAGGETSSSETRAFLLRDAYADRSGYDYVIDLGSPLGGQNRVLARGAQPGDRLCVFDAPHHQYGCEEVESSDDRIGLEYDESWTPLIQVSPVNSQTIQLEVAGLPPTLTLQARIYPEYGFAGEVVTLTHTAEVYSGTIHLSYPAMVGHVQMWVEEEATEINPRREAIVAYAMGGNPGGDRSSWPISRGSWPISRGSWPISRGSWPISRGSWAPLTSPDGQMIFFTEDPLVFEAGDLYTIQGMASLPPLPDGKVAIGQGYNLVASPNVTQLITGSISFQYLSMDVLVEGIDEEELTIHFWDGDQWRALDTVRAPYYNLVSAAGRGSGVYALLAGVTTPYVTGVDPTAARSDVTTTLTINGGYFLNPVDVALVGYSTTYTLPVTALGSTSITAVVTQGLQAGEYQVIVVNHNEPGGGAASPTPGTFALYDPEDACFYDFFESGSGKWERGGEWDIVILPGGEWAMTDSPEGNYNSATWPTLTHTTSITSTPFSLSGCENPVLTIRHTYVIAHVGASQDAGRVEISTDDGATWTELATFSGGGAYGDSAWSAPSQEWAGLGWQETQISLAGYSGIVRLRFSLEVDQYVSDKGWVIDEVIVRSGSELDDAIYLPLVLAGGDQLDVGKPTGLPGVPFGRPSVFIVALVGLSAVLSKTSSKSSGLLRRTHARSRGSPAPVPEKTGAGPDR